MKYELNKRLEEYGAMLLQIENIFAENGELVYKKRNEIKNITFDGISWNVKSFAVPNLINKLIYTFFRESKAKRSYAYSQKISSFVPEPLGYVEYYRYGLLHESYFVSKEFQYDLTIREILFEYDPVEKEKILKAFAKFTFELHEAGICHLDYSPGNILIKQEKEEYVFKIVDINRMQFGEMDIQQRAKNFSRVWLNDEDMKTIIREYAVLASYDYEKMVKSALEYSRKHKEKANFKKHMKERWK
jgi:hypothetical protein